MRFGFNNLLVFLVLSRFFILFIPWLTLTLLVPEGKHLNFVDFTNSAWNRWDGPHYLYLANGWYTNVGDEANFIVFFPLYPLLLKIFFVIWGNSQITAILASIIFYTGGVYFFYKLVESEFSQKIAYRATFLLSIFPTAYFFNAPYTESLFLLLFSSSMYYAKKNNWPLAGLLAGFATISRPFGFLILPSLLIDWFMSEKRKLRFLPVIIIPTLIAGLGYLYLNNLIYENPLQFQKVLASNWHKSFMSPVKSITETWMRAFGGGLTNYAIFVGWAEAITITASWAITPLVFKHLKLSWATFYFLSILLFSSTSFILSTPRYILSVPVVFALLALAENNKVFSKIWRFVSIGLLFSFAVIFASGQWAF